MTDVNSPAFYAHLTGLLKGAGALNSVAELHGVLCGYLCGGLRFELHEWVSLAKDAMDLVDEPNGDLQTALHEMYDATLRQLQSTDFSLALVMPGDEITLLERSQALGEWCQGFLAGIGHTGLGQNDSLDEEVLEMLSDLVAISQIDVTEMGDDMESDYFDVAEYVRMVSIKLFMEFNLKDSTPVVH